MRARTKPDTPINQRLWISVPEAQATIGVGRNTLLKILQESGATVKCGRRRLVNVAKLNAYLETLGAEG